MRVHYGWEAWVLMAGAPSRWYAALKEWHDLDRYPSMQTEKVIGAILSAIFWTAFLMPWLAPIFLAKGHFRVAWVAAAAGLGATGLVILKLGVACFLIGGYWWLVTIVLALVAGLILDLKPAQQEHAHEEIRGV